MEQVTQLAKSVSGRVLILAGLGMLDHLVRTDQNLSDNDLAVIESFNKGITEALKQRHHKPRKSTARRRNESTSK